MNAVLTLAVVTTATATEGEKPIEPVTNTPPTLTTKAQKLSPLPRHKSYMELKTEWETKRQLEQKKELEAIEKELHRRAVKKQKEEEARKKAEQARKLAEQQAKKKAEQERARKLVKQESTTITSRLVELGVSNASYYANLANTYGKQYNIDPVWLLAMMKTESNFNANATSSHGARGVMQILPATGQAMGVSDSSQLYNPEISVRYAAKYLDYLRSRFGSLQMATIAYNQGEGNVQNGTYRTWYLDKINANYHILAR